MFDSSRAVDHGEMVGMKWIWIRHGRTKENQDGKYIGHLDVALGREGKDQVKQLASLLPTDRPAAIYCSDLKRCQETADVISKNWGIKPVSTPALRELHFGRWEGKSYLEIDNEDPALLKAWIGDPYRQSPPEGETLLQLGQRVDKWLNDLKRTMNRDEAAIVVTHGGVIRWFQSSWIHRDPSRFWQVKGLEHGAFFISDWDGEKWNENAVRR